MNADHYSQKCFTFSLYNISDDWMTEEQKAEILNHVETRENTWTRESIELFQRNVPHAKIIEIPHGIIIASSNRRNWSTMKCESSYLNK